VFQISGLLDLQGAFGPAFWISFTLHAFVAEFWLRTRPLPPEMTQSVDAGTGSQVS
jgi:hypothetical protein